MAITLVYAEASGQPNGADAEFNLGAQSLLENDVVVIVGGHAKTSADAGVSTSGYTELADITTGPRCSVSWKRMGATPDSAATVLGAADALYGNNYAIAAFRGVDTTLAIDATTTTASGTGHPNSPSITTVTNNAVVVTAWLCTSDPASVTQPTGYTFSDYWSSQTETNPASSGIAFKTVATAGAENPGPWTLDETGNYIAVSVALRPNISTITSGVFSATGTVDADRIFGASIDSQALSATGTGTATFIDGSITTSPAVFSATGTGTIAFVAAQTLEAVAAMNGTGTASLIGAPLADGVGGITGTVTPTFGGGSLVDIVGAMTGTGTASFVNASQSVGGGAFEATGTGTASFTAQPFDSRPFSMTGTNTTDFVGVPVATQGPFTMTGTGTALFVGTLQGQGNLSADALATITFIGGAITSRAVALTGTGTVNFVGARDRLSHIRETIESRGTVSVSIN
jgi:hypothetical protein